MNAMKSVGIAVFVAAVTATSVVWYIDYKINQVTEAVMAPVYATSEKVGSTIDDIEQTFDEASAAVDATVAQAGDELSSKFYGAGDDLVIEWENALELSSRVGNWLSALAP